MKWWQFLIALLILGGILLIIHYTLIVGKFHIVLGRLKTAGKYSEALRLFAVLEQVPLISGHVYL